MADHMADRGFSLTLKSISVVVLAFFIWTFGGMFDFAYALNSNQQSAVSNQKSKQLSAFSRQSSAQQPESQRPEGKFEKTLEDIGNILADSTSDVNTKKGKLRTKKSEIESLDVEIKKQFAATEKKLKDAGLSLEILQRHYDFVNKYDGNLKELKADLDNIDRAKDKTEADARIDETKKFLEKVKPPKRHRPLDPNKLPHRAAEKVVPKAPRTKAEEFTEGKVKSAKANTGFVQVASNGSLKGLLSADYTRATQNIEIALASPPTNEDLAENIEVQFTPSITAKAAELGNNPVKIYNWVRNNIEYVPTYGSIQGADMCLQTKLCNDFDTASLLIALLRVSGIHARYNYGTIEVPIEKVKNWVGGFIDSTAALNLIASGGIPVEGITDGGQIVTARMEHIWVDAWIDYIPSRGTVHVKGDTWIPLDASFKEFIYQNGLDIKSITGFNPQTFIDGITSTVTVDPFTGSVKNIPTAEVENQLTTMINSLTSYIENNMPDATVGDVLGGKKIIQHSYRILPASLPYGVLVLGNSFSQIPDSLRHRITFMIEDSYGVNQSLAYTCSLPELASKRITLAYTPLTASDAQVLTTYGHFSAPPYLVRLKPILSLEGTQVAEGSDIGMGEIQTLNISFFEPPQGSETISHLIIASGFASIGIDMQRIPLKLLKERQSKLDQTLSKLGQEEVDVDDVIGEILNLHSLAYLYQVELMNRIASRGEIAYSRKTSEMLTTLTPNVAYLYGVPYSVLGEQMNVDVKRQIMAAISLTGNRDKQSTFMLITGQNASALEHAIFEEFNPGAQGVSAVKILTEAMKQGIPIYEITADNMATIISRLQISLDVLNEIKNAVATGKKVYLPERSIQYYDWYGDGYIIIDPATGGGAYMIAGGMAGGGMAMSTGLLSSSAQVLQNISFRTLREAFQRIAAETSDFSSAVKQLLKCAGPIAVLINSFFSTLNMYQETDSAWKAIAAGMATALIGIAAMATIAWLLPGLGLTMIVISIAAVTILATILQTIIVEAIFVAWAPQEYFASYRS